MAQLDIAATDTQMFVDLMKSECSQVPESSMVLSAPLLTHPSVWGQPQLSASA